MPKLSSNRLYFSAMLVCAISTCPACSPVKGYAGPELPAEQISVINLAYDSDWVKVNQAGVDGIQFGAFGIHVLPGKHFFQLTVTLKDPPTHCYSYPQMNRYGYNKCIKKRGAASCNCYDFLEIRRRCTRQVYDGSCEGNLSTQAGAQYDISVYKQNRQAVLNVSGQNSYSSPGHGNCRMLGQRTEQEDSYLGTGRHLAYQHGIYNCY